MSYLLRYMLQPGDILVYSQEAATVVEQSEDDTEPETELLVFERTILVLEPRLEGFFTLEISSQNPGAAQPSDEPPTLVELNSLGGRVDDGESPVVRFLCFPEESLEAGDSWTANEVEPLTGEVLEVEYLVESFEPTQDDLVVNLVALSSSEDEDEGTVTEVSVVTAFSVTRGHQLSSITVVETEWDDGQLSRSVFETKLQSRTAAS